MSFLLVLDGSALVELDVEKSRVRRLMDANDEVSERLETVMGTLKEIMPAVPG